MGSAKRAYDIVVVGAGPAGVAAAAVAAESGRRVAILDDTPWLGGQIWRGEEAKPRSSTARAWTERLRRSGAEILGRAAVIARTDDRTLLAETTESHFEIVAERIILATGARELFLPFPGWTLPNVTGVGGLQVLAKTGWPVAGKRVVIAGTGPLLPAVAEGLRRLGARIVCVAEQAPRGRVLRFVSGLWRAPAKLAQAMRLRAALVTVPYRMGTWPVRAEGHEAALRVWLTNGRSTWSEDCDMLAAEFGLVPNVELALALGCELAEGFVLVDRRQRTSRPWILAAGELVGIGGAECALVEGQIAGYEASGRRTEVGQLVREREGWNRFRRRLQDAFTLREELARLCDDETIVCRCEDVAFGRLKAMCGWREAKLYTRCGMGPCQGRVCGAATRVIWGWGMESVRPPVVAARMSSLLLDRTEDEAR